MKKEEKNKAIKLRQKGCSLSEITRTLNVSKGSASNWVKGIKLTHNQKKRLKIKGRMFGNTHTADFFRDKRLKYQNAGRKMFEKYGYEFLCGCILYWAEGTKSRSTVSLINSDEYILKYFLSFLTKYFGISDNNVKIHCTYYKNASIDEIETFWLKFLNLPRSCLRKSTEVESMRKNHPNGMCRIVISNVRIIQAIYGALQYYFNFKNDKWLD